MTTPINITCQEFHQLRTNNPAIPLIDCREQDEFDLVHIKGARLVPMSKLAERVGELEGLKSQHFVVHCHHGGRSLRVVNWLRQQGFLHAQNLTGGIDQWASDIDTTLVKY
jgi:adenylyltransferase/sulfurtransferase